MQASSFNRTSNPALGYVSMCQCRSQFLEFVDQLPENVRGSDSAKHPHSCVCLVVTVHTTENRFQDGSASNAAQLTHI